MSFAAGFRELVALLACRGHPNVVHLMGMPDADKINPIACGSLRFWLRFEPGGSLDQFLGKHRFTDELLLSIMADVARGLAHIHKRGLIHRDIAARNVFIGLYGQAVIGDLGLMRFVDEQGLSPIGKGEMLPVLLRRCALSDGKGGWAVSQKADIWTAGVMFAELAAGCPMTTPDMLAAFLPRLRAAAASSGKAKRVTTSAVLSCLERGEPQRPTAAELCAMLGVDPRDETSPALPGAQQCTSLTLACRHTLQLLCL